jgi:hypothetical protein
LSVFIVFAVVVDGILHALTPATSLAFLFFNAAGFFGCGITITGSLMAVLYANAFDIDLFVRRTLVYTLLTASLVVVYLGLVFGAQVGLASFNTQAAQSPLIVVGSTLVVVVLFYPLRQRIQTLIDRRFYRQRYDAARVVAAFNATLREELDLDQLRATLLSVVQETMQPAHVSLWVRQPGRAELPAAEVSTPFLAQAGSQEELARQEG